MLTAVNITRRAAQSVASVFLITRQSRQPLPHSTKTSRWRWPAPVRAYIEELLPDVLEGRIEPGRVFDPHRGLDGVPDGYRAMNEREAIKVMVKP